MRIGVISDTHIPKRAQSLPDDLVDVLRKLDFIIHAGDFETMEALREIERINRLVAVHGNMDSPDVRRQLPNRRVLNVEHVRIGIIHGWGDPHTLPERVMEQFKDDDVRCIIFGHSHQAMCEERKGILLFNPGSPTDTIFAHFRSYGILEVTREGVKGEIIRLD
ncbi:TPA: metallophosphoesterase [Candidatus Poribacteria bacterium]|nr:metallophosphoesterase [Candidatus Poribacteria bacterium]HEX30613.1 metallophosphoesterase [Candidatus Poribacteria bacterium]